MQEGTRREWHSGTPRKRFRRQQRVPSETSGCRYRKVDTGGNAATGVGCFSYEIMETKEVAPESTGFSDWADHGCWWEPAHEGERALMMLS